MLFPLRGNGFYYFYLFTGINVFKIFAGYASQRYENKKPEQIYGIIALSIWLHGPFSPRVFSQQRQK